MTPRSTQDRRDRERREVHVENSAYWDGGGCERLRTARMPTTVGEHHNGVLGGRLR